MLTYQQAVTVASNIAGFGNKEDICPIVMSDIFLLIILMLKRMEILIIGVRKTSM